MARGPNVARSSFKIGLQRPNILYINIASLIKKTFVCVKIEKILALDQTPIFLPAVGLKCAYLGYTIIL
jgi:hypothetical protein